MVDERRRAPRTPVADVTVVIKERGVFGRTLDKAAHVLDISSLGMGLSISPPAPLKVGKNYLLGFELTWLHDTRYLVVKVVHSEPVSEGTYRIGVRVIEDKESTVSFITTAMKGKDRS